MLSRKIPVNLTKNFTFKLKNFYSLLYPHEDDAQSEITGDRRSTGIYLADGQENRPSLAHPAVPGRKGARETKLVMIGSGNFFGSSRGYSKANVGTC